MSKPPSMRTHAKNVMDSRRYERRRRLYIDVLHIPDISEAVEQASAQLRSALMKAMEANKCDDDGNLIEPTAKLKAKTKEKPKGPTDSHHLYSMLTTRVQKENEKKVAAMREARQRGESVESALNPMSKTTPPSTPQKKSRLLATNKPKSGSESDPKPSISAAQALVSNAGSVPENEDPKPSNAPRSTAKPKPVVHSWKSTAKAGPGILSKRPRADSSNDCAPAQPAPKRPAPTTLASIIQIAANESPAKPLPASSRAQSPGPKRSASFIANSSKIAALRAKEARSKAIDNSNYVHTRKAVPKPSATRTLLDLKASAKSTSKLPIARPLPISVRAPTKLVPLNRASSAVSRTVLEAGNRTTAQTIARRGTTGGEVKKNRLGGSRSLLPMVPSLMSRARPNPRVMFPPGIEAIGTVRPNGYEMTPAGLKPVVTPDSKIPPKVPMKLRQTTTEKLFAAWRDKQKLPEMDALVRALRAEQTMFAQAAGKIDYRAAAITQLQSANTADEAKGGAASSTR